MDMMNSELLKKAQPETTHEIAFLRKIGTYNEHARRIPRAELLRGYLAGCKKRTRWGTIDSAKVIAFAEAELAREVGAGRTATDGHNAKITGG